MFAALARRLARHRARREAERQLRAMDARTLADLGLEPGQVAPLFDARD